MAAADDGDPQGKHTPRRSSGLELYLSFRSHRGFIEFKREVKQHLTGRKTESWELLYFKLYKSQLAVIEQDLETAGLMLGSDKSRGYCLEMICADFLAGASLQDGNPEALFLSVHWQVGMLSPEQRQDIFRQAEAAR